MKLDEFAKKAASFLFAEAPRAETNGKVRAAAMALASEIDGETSLGLIVRSEKSSVHAGQIAFPGGRMEIGETPLQTALRETEEEIGAAAESIETLGFLPTTKTVSTGFIVWTCVGLMRERPTMRLAREEVSEFFWVPLDRFMDESLLRRRTQILPGETEPRPAFVHEGREIWGLTLRIILSLTEGLKQGY